MNDNTSRDLERALLDVVNVLEQYFNEIGRVSSREEMRKVLGHLSKPAPAATDGGLFQLGNFKLHSGGETFWKIDCDALTDSDIETIAKIVSDGMRFSKVIGVPRGGDRLAKALIKYISQDGPMLIVDDVLTTGKSLEKAREGYPGAIGVVIFARGRCPSWVKPMFSAIETPSTDVVIGVNEDILIHVRKIIEDQNWTIDPLDDRDLNIIEMAVQAAAPLITVKDKTETESWKACANRWERECARLSAPIRTPASESEIEEAVKIGWDALHAADNTLRPWTEAHATDKRDARIFTRAILNRTQASVIAEPKEENDLVVKLRTRSLKAEAQANNMRGDPEDVYYEAALLEEAASAIEKRNMAVGTLSKECARPALELHARGAMPEWKDLSHEQHQDIYAAVYLTPNTRVAYEAIRSAVPLRDAGKLVSALEDTREALMRKFSFRNSGGIVAEIDAALKEWRG